ncbi:MAG: hypothetical protein JSS23_03080 [Proteobacteria bacterium]|nr:hypothetical protein [Pseudomonadota bacterium]
MTDIVVPTAISALPPAPQPNDTPAQFDSKAFASLSAQVGMVAQTNLAAAATYQNAVAANERAVAANDSASNALASKNAAALDAARLAALDALWLGASATDPTTGRGGAALVAGNAYVNSSTGAVRAYTGTAWVQGLAGGAGVASLNGQSGTLVKSTLLDYGITDAVNKGAWMADGVDINTLVTTGHVRMGATALNGPMPLPLGFVDTVRIGDALAQWAYPYNKTELWFRTAAPSIIGGAGGFNPWRRVAMNNDAAVQATGGAMDCSAGNRFTATISSNTTLTFSNIPAGSSYACVLEVNHTGGAITLPAGSVLSNSSPLNTVSGKRHLLYFERVQLGTAGWYVSTLPNYAP